MTNRITVRSAEETRRFYDDLVEGRVARGLWGKERRFDTTGIGAKPSVQRHFMPVVAPYLQPTDDVLDLGCGPGGFLLLLAERCRRAVGADITPGFVELTKRAIAERGIANAEADLIAPGKLPYADASFDKVLMLDTIHHLENAAGTMAEVSRVLKPGGLLLVFEPNKLNPLLWLMCLLDRNEHGLLRLGTSAKYRALLGAGYDIVEDRWSGLLIGPDGPAARFVADRVSTPPFSSLFGWLSPKLFIAARKAR
jgi:SAM-dependent methyltransferase